MSQPPNGILIGSAVFIQPTRVRNSHTTRQTDIHADRHTDTRAIEIGLITIIIIKEHVRLALLPTDIKRPDGLTLVP